MFRPILIGLVTFCLVNGAMAQLQVKNSSGHTVMEIDDQADMTLGSSQHAGNLTTDNVFVTDKAGIQTTSISGALDVRGDEVRFWDGSGSVNAAAGAGDLYVQNILEVDDDVIVSDYVGAQGGVHIGATTDPGDALLRVNAENDGTFAVYASGKKSYFSHSVCVGSSTEPLTDDYLLWLADPENPAIGFTNTSEDFHCAISAINGQMRTYSMNTSTIFLDYDNNDPDEDTQFIVGHNAPAHGTPGDPDYPWEILLSVNGLGNMRLLNEMSAASYIDRTPYPEDVETAYDAVFSMNRLPDGRYQAEDRDHQLDHSQLHEFIRSSDNKRDLSATVSAQNEVIKDLVNQVKALKEQVATLSRQ